MKSIRVDIIDDLYYASSVFTAWLNDMEDRRSSVQAYNDWKSFIEIKVGAIDSKGNAERNVLWFDDEKRFLFIQLKGIDNILKEICNDLQNNV
jgi:hypothetical protein